MFAVVEIAKKQYIIRKGDLLDVQKLKDTSDEIIFDKVLLLADGDKVDVGTPYVPGAKVKAGVEGQKKGKKIIVYKCKKRKKYRKKQGHRQNYTTVKINDILSSVSGEEECKLKEPASEKKSSEKFISKKIDVKKTSSKPSNKKS